MKRFSILMLATMVCGCGGEVAVTPGAASTPRGTMNNLADAIEAGETHWARDCIAGPVEMKKLITSSSELAYAQYRFVQAMAKTFGNEEYLKGVLNPVEDIRGARFERSWGVVWMCGKSWPNSPRDAFARMTRCKGVWRVDYTHSSRPMTKEILEPFVVTANLQIAQAEVYRSVLSEITKPGASEEGIKQALAEALVRASSIASKTPPETPATPSEKK